MTRGTRPLLKRLFALALLIAAFVVVSDQPAGASCGSCWYCVDYCGGYLEPWCFDIYGNDWCTDAYQSCLGWCFGCCEI